ncbi:hypothetical protein ACMDCT_00870 [Halomonadaceae bacterium KBTZ08]
MKVTVHSPWPVAPERRRIAGHMVMLLGGLFALWWFMRLGRVLGDVWVVAVWAGVALVMARGLFRRARIRRRAWRHAYLDPESPWNRWLRGGPLLFFSQLVKAGALSAVLLASVVRVGGEPVFWRLMLVAVLLFVWGRMKTEQVVWWDVAPGYRPELVARLGQCWTAAVLVPCLVAWALVQPQPDFRDASLEQALWHAADQEVAVSAVVERAAQWLALWHGLEQWAAQQVSALELSHWVRGGVWLSVLVRQSLFVMSLLVVFNGVLAGSLHDGQR